VGDAQRLGYFVYRYNGRISAALLYATQKLLAETRNFGELLLGQALFQPVPLNVSAQELAHIHRQESAKYTL